MQAHAPLTTEVGRGLVARLLDKGRRGLRRWGSPVVVYVDYVSGAHVSAVIDVALTLTGRIAGDDWPGPGSCPSSTRPDRLTTRGP